MLHRILQTSVRGATALAILLSSVCDANQIPRPASVALTALFCRDALSPSAAWVHHAISGSISWILRQDLEVLIPFRFGVNMPDDPEVFIKTIKMLANRGEGILIGNTARSLWRDKRLNARQLARILPYWQLSLMARKISKADIAAELAEPIAYLRANSDVPEYRTIVRLILAALDAHEARLVASSAPPEDVLKRVNAASQWIVTREEAKADRDSAFCIAYYEQTSGEIHFVRGFLHGKRYEEEWNIDELKAAIHEWELGVAESMPTTKDEDVEMTALNEMNLAWAYYELSLYSPPEEKERLILATHTIFDKNPRIAKFILIDARRSFAARVLSDAGNSAQALTLLEQIRKSELQSAMHANLMLVQPREGQYKEASASADRIDKSLSRHFYGYGRTHFETGLRFGARRAADFRAAYDRWTLLLDDHGLAMLRIIGEEEAFLRDYLRISLALEKWDSAMMSAWLLEDRPAVTAEAIDLQLAPAERALFLEKLTTTLSQEKLAAVIIALDAFDQSHKKQAIDKLDKEWRRLANDRKIRRADLDAFFNGQLWNALTLSQQVQLMARWLDRWAIGVESLFVSVPQALAIHLARTQTLLETLVDRWVDNQLAPISIDLLDTLNTTLPGLFVLYNEHAPAVETLDLLISALRRFFPMSELMRRLFIEISGHRTDPESLRRLRVRVINTLSETPVKQRAPIRAMINRYLGPMVQQRRAERSEARRVRQARIHRTLVARLEIQEGRLEKIERTPHDEKKNFPLSDSEYRGFQEARQAIEADVQQAYRGELTPRLRRFDARIEALAHKASLYRAEKTRVESERRQADIDHLAALREKLLAAMDAKNIVKRPVGGGWLFDTKPMFGVTWSGDTLRILMIDKKVLKQIEIQPDSFQILEKTGAAPAFQHRGRLTSIEVQPTGIILHVDPQSARDYKQWLHGRTDVSTFLNIRPVTERTDPSSDVLVNVQPLPLSIKAIVTFSAELLESWWGDAKATAEGEWAVEQPRAEATVRNALIAVQLPEERFNELVVLRQATGKPIDVNHYVAEGEKLLVTLKQAWSSMMGAGFGIQNKRNLTARFA
jgi:hypothetical protein